MLRCTSNDLDHNILKDVHGGTPYVTYVLEATYVVVDMGCELRLLSEKCVPNRKFLMILREKSHFVLMKP